MMLGVLAVLLVAIAIGVGAVLITDGENNDPIVTPLPAVTAPSARTAAEPASGDAVDGTGLAVTGAVEPTGLPPIVDDPPTDTAAAANPHGRRQPANMRRTTMSTSASLQAATNTTTTQTPDPPPTMETRRATSMSGGLVGIDEFDEGLRNR